MFKSLIVLFVAMFVFASLMIGQTLYQSDLKENITRNIYNTTSLIEPNFSCNYLYENNYSDIPRFKAERLNKIVCSFAEFAVTAGIESAKFGIEFGYENPQYDYNWYMKVFKLYIYILLLSILIPLIIPLAALIYLIAFGIYNLIIKIKRRKQ